MTNDHDSRALTESLAGLLPVGYAWPRDAASVLMRAIAGLGAALGEHHAVVQQTTREWLPQLTHTRLSEWEAATDLPNADDPAERTEAARQAALLARLRGTARAYVDSSACAPHGLRVWCEHQVPGHTVEVWVNHPFRAGHRCGRRLGLNGRLQVRVTPPLADPTVLQRALERVAPARLIVSIS